MKNSTVAAISVISIAIGFIFRGFLTPNLAEKTPTTNPSQHNKKKYSNHSQKSNWKARLNTHITSNLTKKQITEFDNSMDSLMILELIRINPEFAADILQDRDATVIERYKNELIESWRFNDPVASYEWLQKHQNLFTTEQFDRKQILILEEMAKQLPEKAKHHLGKLQSQEARDQLALALASGWAQRNPEEAFKTLAEFENYDISDHALSQSYATIFSAFATSNSESAIQLFEQLDNEELQKQLLHPILNKLGQTNLDHAIHWSFNQSNQTIQDAAIEQLISQFGYQQPELILKTTREHSEILSAASVTKMIGPLSEAAPEQAITTLEQLDYNDKGAAAETAIGSWLRKDQESALNWLNKQNDPTFKEAGAKATSSYLAEIDPVTATLWAFHVSDKNERMQLVQNASRNADLEQLNKIEQAMQTTPLENREYAELSTLLEKQKQKFTSSLVIP